MWNKQRSGASWSAAALLSAALGVWLSGAVLCRTRAGVQEKRPTAREVIAAIDFFTVPTVTFRFLYCFFAIGHNRRRILHLNLTEHPTGQWIVQQLREAFPNESAHRYLILDRDAKFSESVIDAIKTMGTSYQSPWQNGVAERWVASCRQDLLDHVIVLNEAQSR